MSHMCDIINTHVGGIMSGALIYPLDTNTIIQSYINQPGVLNS